MDDASYISSTKKWIENFVLGLNLCPFAVGPYLNTQVKIRINQEEVTVPVVNDILEEAALLDETSGDETSFIVTPQLRLGFEAFYEFVSDLQILLDRTKESHIALVAFHPEFKYADSHPDDTANATNRSPFPMIHLLKKESLDNAERSGINIDQLLQKNQRILSGMSWKEINALYT